MRQANLDQFDDADPSDDREIQTRSDLDVLTEKQREAYVKCELGDVGPRQLARETDRSPGTISNLLRSARERLEGSE